jgi:hypothetical protein
MIGVSDSKPQIQGLLSPLADLFIRWKQFGDADVQDGKPDPLMERARESVWLLRRFYEEATKDHFAEEVLREFRFLIPSGPRAVRFFVVWIDLVETLCQEAERQYGSKKGQGEYKSQQVKAAMIHLILDNEGFDIPGIPSFLEPIVVEVFVGISIDTVVKLLNQDKTVLWHPAPPGPKPGQNFFAWIILGVIRFGKWLMSLAPVARLGATLRRWSQWATLKANPLAPAVRKAIERIQESDGPTISEVLTKVKQLIDWLAKHRDNVVAMIELVSVAVQDAESLIPLSGSDKKIYAKDLVIAFLEEYDIIRSQFAYIIAEWILDWAIDSVVNIFNKREAFQHRDRATA